MVERKMQQEELDAEFWPLRKIEQQHHIRAFGPRVHARPPIPVPLDRLQLRHRLGIPAFLHCSSGILQGTFLCNRSAGDTQSACRLGIDLIGQKPRVFDAARAIPRLSRRSPRRLFCVPRPELNRAISPASNLPLMKLHLLHFLLP